MMVITQKITSLAFEIHDGEHVGGVGGYLLLRPAVYTQFGFLSFRNGTKRGTSDSWTEDFGDKVCFSVRL